MCNSRAARKLAHRSPRQFLAKFLLACSLQSGAAMPAPVNCTARKRARYRARASDSDAGHNSLASVIISKSAAPKRSPVIGCARPIVPRAPSKTAPMDPNPEGSPEGNTSTSMQFARRRCRFRNCIHTRCSSIRGAVLRLYCRRRLSLPRNRGAGIRRSTRALARFRYLAARVDPMPAQDHNRIAYVLPFDSARSARARD